MKIFLILLLTLIFSLATTYYALGYDRDFNDIRNSREEQAIRPNYPTPIPEKTTFDPKLIPTKAVDMFFQSRIEQIRQINTNPNFPTLFPVSPTSPTKPNANFPPPAAITIFQPNFPMATPQPTVRVNTAPNISVRLIKGSPNAKVKMIEFADFECPYCRMFALDILPKIDAEYIQTGKVFFIFKHNPLTSIHQNAYTAATIAECATLARFWKTHNVIFQNQNSWADLDKTGALNKLVSLAVSQGNNETMLRNCLKTPYASSGVLTDLKEAGKLSVDGVPYFNINGTVVYGAQSYNTFKQIIESKINQ